MPLWSKARVFPANRDMGATTHLGVESARMAACLQSFCMHSVEPSVRVSCCSAISARCGSGRPLRAASLRVFSRTRAPALLGLVLLRATSTPSEVGRHERNVVLVTGASRGLGLEIARGFGELGHAVVLTSRDIVAGSRATEEFQTRGLDVTYSHLDIKCKSSISRVIDKCKAGTLPVPTILVNNGAICVEGSSRDVLNETLSVNFYGARCLTEGLMPLMAGLQRRRRQGRQRESCVVNISSGDGELAFLCSELQEMIRKAKRLDQLDALADGLVDTSVLPDQELAFGPTPAYCVSKALLNAYTRLRAVQGLNVIAVCPGDVATRMCSDPESPILQSPQQASQDVISLALRCGTDSGLAGGFFRHGELISM